MTDRDLGPCTLWTGRINADGYGTIGVDLAHRRAWEDTVGPIPDGLELDHLCRNRACIRIDHLEPVTRRTNIDRSDVGGPNRRKDECPRGHPYAGDNLLVSGGRRYCRACKRDNQRRVRAARKSSADPCPRCGEPFDAVNARGSRYCTACTSAQGRANMSARWHGDR